MRAAGGRGACPDRFRLAAHETTMSHPMPQKIPRLAVRAIPGIALAALAHAGPIAANDGDWPMAARDFASTRFSPLIDITPSNAATLKLAFTFSTGVVRGHEAAPIVAGNTMFIITPYPNIVYALDLSR